MWIANKGERCDSRRFAAGLPRVRGSWLAQASQWARTVFDEAGTWSCPAGSRVMVQKVEITGGTFFIGFVEIRDRLPKQVEVAK